MGDRNNYINSWLTEEPQSIGDSHTDMFFLISSTIKNLLDSGHVPQDLGGGYKAFIFEETSYWWLEIDGTIIMAVEFSIKPQNWTIRAAGKNPAFQGKMKPYHLSDLYAKVLDFGRKNLRITSDDQLSDGGYKIWKNLLQSGYKISVYDMGNPGVIIHISDADELEKYTTPDQDSKRYQYVLSEAKIGWGDMIGHFGIRRIRELCGFSLTDDY